MYLTIGFLGVLIIVLLSLLIYVDLDRNKRINELVSQLNELKEKDRKLEVENHSNLLSKIDYEEKLMEESARIYAEVGKTHEKVFNSWREQERERINKELSESYLASLNSERERIRNDYLTRVEDEVHKKRDELIAIFATWKEQEKEKLRLEFERTIEKEREDAIKRSKSVIRGKGWENFIPFSDKFLEEYNPSDLKFLGAPLDIIIFKGASDITDGQESEIEICLGDVKSGRSRLTKVQKKIKEAVEAKRIRWITLEVKEDKNVTSD